MTLSEWCGATRKLLFHGSLNSQGVASEGHYFPKRSFHCWANFSSVPIMVPKPAAFRTLPILSDPPPFHDISWACMMPVIRVYNYFFKIYPGQMKPLGFWQQGCGQYRKPLIIRSVGSRCQVMVHVLRSGFSFKGPFSFQDNEASSSTLCCHHTGLEILSSSSPPREHKPVFLLHRRIKLNC